jgi:uncharacterized BrkB/YihY/UPF0761 family membrane protein
MRLRQRIEGPTARRGTASRTPRQSCRRHQARVARTLRPVSNAKEAAENWSSHMDSRQGAALAYYSVFSLGPVIVIAIAVAGFFFG